MNVRFSFSLWPTVELVRADHLFRLLADRQTAADDEEGRVALMATPAVEDFQDNGNRIALLDTEVPASSRRTRKKTCCMCCGLE